MTLAFPATPTDGQKFPATPPANGLQWVYRAGKGVWDIAAAGAATGPVTIDADTPEMASVFTVGAGGVKTTFTGDGTNGELGQKYEVYTFTDPTKNGTPDNQVTVTKGGIAHVLLVGGGGAGGRNGGGFPPGYGDPAIPPGVGDGHKEGRGCGGGGGGGVLEMEVAYLPPGTWDVTVGDGGVTSTGQCNTTNPEAGGPGGDTVFANYVAEGGGGGAGHYGGVSRGGSGGGNYGSGGAPGLITQGFPGDGGGGGAGGPGTAAGGPGRSSSISGTVVEYGHGGAQGGGYNCLAGGAAPSAWNGVGRGGDVRTHGGIGAVVVRIPVP